MNTTKILAKDIHSKWGKLTEAAVARATTRYRRWS
jgi:hypothetical protein